MPAPTLRTLAKELGLSRTTISEALRGSPRVQPETAARIRAAATAAGYRHNPLAGAVMSELRRSRGSVFRGVLALVDLDEPQRPSYARKFHQALADGATERATALGFKAEMFLVGEHGVPVRRLDTILQSRGIEGVFLLPAWSDPDFSNLDWSRYAGVYTDYVIERPSLHSVCSDHFRSLISALQRLHAMGYKRPGLLMDKHEDERLQHRWKGSFLAFQYSQPGIEHVPPLVCDTITEAPFAKWYQRHQPDIVIGHRTEVLAWLRKLGRKVPQDVGYFSLNLLRAEEPCAGLDQQPHLLGARGAELIIGQLYHNERGIPEHASTTSIPGHWIDGPTIRRRA